VCNYRSHSGPIKAKSNPLLQILEIQSTFQKYIHEGLVKKKIKKTESGTRCVYQWLQLGAMQSTTKM